MRSMLKILFIAYFSFTAPLAAAVSSAPIESRIDDLLAMFVGKKTIQEAMTAVERQLPPKTVDFLKGKIDASKKTDFIFIKKNSFDTVTIGTTTASTTVKIVNTDKNTFTINGNNVSFQVDEAPLVTWEAITKTLMPSPPQGAISANGQVLIMASVTSLVVAGACYRSLPKECDSSGAKYHELIVKKQTLPEDDYATALTHLETYRKALSGPYSQGCAEDRTSLSNCVNDLSQKLQALKPKPPEPAVKTPPATPPAPAPAPATPPTVTPAPVKPQ